MYGTINIFMYFNQADLPSVKQKFVKRKQFQLKITKGFEI